VETEWEVDIYASDILVPNFANRIKEM